MSNLKVSTTITNPNISSLPLDTILEYLVEARFDAVDMPGEPGLFPVRLIKDIYPSYEKNLPIAEITACINPDRDLINEDKAARQGAIDYVKQCIDLASELGVNLTHACFITSETNLKTTPRETLHRRARDSLGTLAKHAADKGVCLLLEPLFAGDNTIVKTARDAVSLFSKALSLDEDVFLHEQEEFGLLLDIFHMHNEEKDIDAAIDLHAPVTKHVHVADHVRSLDFTRGDSEFAAKAIDAFYSRGYAGFISFESFHDSVALDRLGEALAQLRGLLGVP